MCDCPQHREVEAFVVCDPHPNWSHVRPQHLVRRFVTESAACDEVQEGRNEKKHPVVHSDRRQALYDARRRLKAHRLYRAAWRRVRVNP